MSDQPPQPAEKQSRFHIGEFLMWLIVLAVIAGGTWYAVKKSQFAAKPQPTAEQIRQTFAPPPNFKASFRPPAPSVADGAPGQDQTVNKNNNLSTGQNPILPRGPAVAGAETYNPNPNTASAGSQNGP